MYFQINLTKNGNHSVIPLEIAQVTNQTVIAHPTLIKEAQEESVLTQILKVAPIRDTLQKQIVGNPKIQ